MKRLYISLVVLLLATLTVSSKVITVDQAMEVAMQFANRPQMLSSSHDKQCRLQLSHVTRSLDGSIDYYVFNRNEDDGFIIVSGDDLSLPVWGYSEHGSFNINELPENVRWWLSEYQSQLQWLRRNPSYAARQNPVIAASVSPLLNTFWDQIYPYNMYCPYTFYGPGRHAYTGCLATAMAQVMKYHSHPATGAGDHTYTFKFDGQMTILSADFSKSVYNWNQMLNSYGYSYTTEQADAVARLMSDVGISINMVYGASSSFAKYIDAVEAMVAYFDYSPSIQYKLKNKNSGSWATLLRNEIDARRPVFYFGQKSRDEGYGGHAFVVDGYNDSGYFHINWGWGGDYDGYFMIDLFSPGNATAAQGYNTDQGAIIKIEPDVTGTGGIVLKGDLKPGSTKMSANDIQASVDVEAVGGPYQGTLQLPVSILNDQGNYSWNYANVLTCYVSLQPNQKQTVTFKGSCNLEDGKTYYLLLINPYCTESNYIWGNVASFTVGQWPIIKGDVNGDHEVNIADINVIINIILGGQVDSSTLFRADVNHDREINIADVNAVIQYIKGE